MSVFYIVVLAAAAALTGPAAADCTAGLRIARLGNSSVRYEIGLFREGSEALAAEGWFVHVFVERSTRRPTPLPARMRQTLEKLIVPAPEAR